MSAPVTDPLRLKIDLQALGMRMPPEIDKRAGGAGPADGITIFIGDLVATVPTGAWYAGDSPYELYNRSDGSWHLAHDDGEVARVTLADEPGFYRRSTVDNITYRSLALRHGRDAIGSTVAQGCSHGDLSCKFCAISASKLSGATLASKTPGQLAEVAEAAEAEGFTHIVMTTGSTGEDAGITHLAACAAAVRERTSMKIHVQFEPPEDPALIDLAASVADTAAINIESFDEAVLGNMAPSKARAGMERYRDAWNRAVQLLGEGQVTSFVIVGLGESSRSIIDGSKLLVSLGVYPYLLPLRPLPGTPLESWQPPPPDATMDIFERAAAIVTDAGLRASSCLAGCVRCGACTTFTDLTG